MTTVIVGALALCAWFARITFKTYLETPHTYGSITVIPFGHDMEGVFLHTWDSLKVKTKKQTYTINKLDFHFSILGENRGLRISSNKVNIEITTDNTTQPQSKTNKKQKVAFPEKIKIYLPTKLNIDTISVNINGNQWNAQKFSLYNNGLQNFSLKIDSISGKNIAHTATLRIQTDFENDSVSIKTSIKTPKDHVLLNTKAPKNNLLAIQSHIEVEIEKPKDWIPKLPSSVPSIGVIQLKADGKLHPDTYRPSYKATLNTRIGEFWPLLALNTNIQVSGDDKNIHSNILLKNDEGGFIDLQIDLDNKLNGYATGRVERMSAQYGPQIMPMDMIIHSAEKEGSTINATVETRNGSIIDASMNFENQFSLTYTGNMSPYEPWALDWCNGNLVFRDRYKIYGSFADGKMRALVKIDTIPFVYHITADSMQTVLVLDKNGIDFSNGIIYTPKETFDFTGDVKWEKGNAPHTSWKVTQRHGGSAEAYISILDSITINATATNVEASTIPLAGFKFSEKQNGKVSGHWVQNFETKVGKLDMSIDGYVQPFNLQANIVAHENGDTIFIDKAEALQSKNKGEAEAIFILPNDSNPDFKPTSTLPIQVIQARASSREFSIPVILEPLGDTTFTSGFISGDISFNEGKGLQGNVNFSDVKFSNIPPQLFNVKKMDLFAEGDKMELNAYLGIGGGGWTGNTQITLDNIFESNRHVSISHNSDNGGDLIAEGFIDNSLTFNGIMNATGSWFVPGTVSEIKKTDIHVDFSAKLKEGLKGITADIRSDSTLYQPPKLNLLFPIRLRGHLQNSILDISEAKTSNDRGENVSATMQFDLEKLKLNALDIHSDQYTLQKGAHTLITQNVTGHMEDEKDELIISGNIPSIRYSFQDESYGQGEALGKGELNLIIPHSQDGLLQNMTLGGSVIIDKLVYHKNLEIEVTPNSLNKFITMFNNAIAKLNSKETEAKLSTANPINLSIHVSDSQSDSVQVVTPFATFPFTFDTWILGTTSRPLLRGDISNTNNGFIGIKDIYQFDLNSFRVSWTDVPWQSGILDVSSSQELPYCNDTEENDKETCPINLDIQGTITNPQPNPSSNCGKESSAAAIYYNIFLGCIAEDVSENTDWNKVAGKAIGKVISSTANKTLGGDYIGDIDMKVMLFNTNTSNEKDSSYFKMPISLDRWVKDLSLVLGYTQDQSENPTYDQSLQFGINYTLPVFKEKEYSHKNHLSPNLSLFAQLVSKQYLTNTGTESNENRVEKNIGVNYIYRYWNPCLLGMGHCETIDKTNEDKTETKKNDDKKENMK